MATRFLTLALFSLMLAACGGRGGWADARVPGLLYEHTMRPLVMDMHETPFVSEEGDPRHIHKVEVRGIQINEGDNSIGGIAKASGLKTVTHADLEIFRILIYQRTTVHVYGYRD